MTNRTLTDVAPLIEALHAEAAANDDEAVIAAAMEAAVERGASSEQEVAEQGLRRDRVTVVPSFAAPAHMVTDSDAIGLMPTAIVVGLGAEIFP